VTPTQTEASQANLDPNYAALACWRSIPLASQQLERALPWDWGMRGNCLPIVDSILLLSLPGCETAEDDNFLALEASTDNLWLDLSDQDWFYCIRPEARARLSPPASEGSIFTGITGIQ
jgi:hypothetical protein